MASAQRSEKSDDLIDSWVELSCDQHGKVAIEVEQEPRNTDLTVSYASSIERLLIDAQRESTTPSRCSNESSRRDSPKFSATPNNEWSNEEWQPKQDPGTDWLWDWSSRPEAQQSLSLIFKKTPKSDFSSVETEFLLTSIFDKLSERLRFPGCKPSYTPFSVRNTQVMKKTRLFSWANLPMLLLTHACTFFLGAASVFVYLKKYCNISGIAKVTLD